jgi:hypothetical protein
VLRDTHPVSNMLSFDLVDVHAKNSGYQGRQV